MRHHFQLRTVAAVIVLAASLLSTAGCSGGASGPPVVVYEDGWHGAEFQLNSQASWRWTTGHAVVSFRNPRGAARLMLEVQGRPNVFETPQQLSLRLGEQVLEELSLDTPAPVMIDRTLTAAELGSDDVVRLELRVDQTFIPSELGMGDDARELGVRVLTVYVEPI